MKTIKKKVWSEYFQEILNGKKTFELRLNDFEIAEGAPIWQITQTQENQKWQQTIKRKVLFPQKNRFSVLPSPHFAPPYCPSHRGGGGAFSERTI